VVVVPAPTVTTTTPDSATVAAVRELLDRVAREDGREPLSDQALTRLASSGVEHAVARTDGRVIGYAQLDGDSLEIAAEPGAIGELLDVFAGRPVLVWAHGRGSRLTAPLTARGYVARRRLHQLRRDLDQPLDAPPSPESITIRPFVVGEDENAWLAVNATAFADHPEQGSWTRADLEAREREPWFTPSGFLMAWRDGELLGFHWTKVHPDHVGEVYVIATAPAAQGTGLGTALLLHGLDWLREQGCTQVLLYVDGYNVGAMRLYERYGFAEHDLDVQWAAPELAQSSSSGSVSNT
jgi:mycothiol synthase